MKHPNFESANAAMTPRKTPLQERRESRHQSGIKEVSVHALPEDRRLAELLGVDDAPAVEGILRNALLRPGDLTSNRASVSAPNWCPSVIGF